MRSDEELSEMEEFIDMCCRESPHAVTAPRFPFSAQWCPVHAVAGERDTTLGLDILGLGFDGGASGLWRGFDGDPARDYDDPQLFAMGRRFRERALAGEYVKGGAA